MPGMRVGTKCWTRSANRASETIGARKSLFKMVLTLASKLEGPESSESNLHGCQLVLRALSLTRLEKMAAPRLPPDTPLIMKTCWAKLGHRSWMRASTFAANWAA